MSDSWNKERRRIAIKSLKHQCLSELYDRRGFIARQLETYQRFMAEGRAQNYGG